MPNYGKNRKPVKGQLMLSALLLTGFLTNLPTVSQTCIWEYAFPSCDDGNVLNGYWWRSEAWVPMYPSIESWFTPAPLHFEGNAVFYARGVMEATAKARGLSLDNFLDGVALISPSDIGLPVWLRRPGHSWEGPFLVVDSSMRGDAYPIVVYRKEAVEIGWRTAKRWGMVNDKGKVEMWRIANVEVSKINPNDITEATVGYKSWWLEHLTEATYRDFGTPPYRSPSTWRLNGVWTTFVSPDPSYSHDISFNPQ